jgi:DNA-binding GntR family transcriptional regulator
MQERNVDFDYDSAIRDHEVLVDLIRNRNQASLDKEIATHINNTLDKRLGSASAPRRKEPVK